MTGFYHILHKIRILLSGFRAKLLLAFLLCTILPLSLVGFIAYSISFSVAEKQVLESVFLTAGGQHQQIETKLQQAEQVGDTLQYSLYTLKASSYGSASDYIETFIMLRNNISLYQNTFGFYHVYVFLPEEYIGSNEGLTFLPLSKIKDYNITPEEIKRLGSSSLWKTQEKTKLPAVTNQYSTGKNTGLCFRALFNQGNETLEYAFMVLLDTEKLGQILAAALPGSAISSYIVTSDGLVAAHSDSSKNNSYLDADTASFLLGSSSDFVKRNNHYYFIKPFSNGWLHITDVPDDEIRKSTTLLLRTIFFMLVFSIPAVFIVVLIFSKTLTARLQLLADAMTKYRLSPDGGESLNTVLLPHRKNADYYDEIDMLGITYDQMIQTIHRNLNSILDLSLSEERLKYQLLQSQINPHFLYNILGSIRNCILLGKLETADQMIAHLTNFYRMTLRKSEDLITIGDELKIALLYLEMEKLCLNQNLSWEINMDDGIDNFMICKFTLQPFFENCILHGLSGKNPSIHIRVFLQYAEDRVCIRIQDNGAGMSDNQLNELRQTLIHRSVNYQKHFGISNVSARISNALFGNGQVLIDSRPFHGTTVTILFDQMEGPHEEDYDC